MLVLMYHRIASPSVDPWSLAVSAEHFAEQLRVLRECARPVPLGALWNLRREQTADRPAVALTFDDGYADNWTVAAALLREAHIPATIFVATGAIGSQTEFWWDELEGLLLQPGRRPSSLPLSIGGEHHRWDLEGAARYPADLWDQHRSWKAFEPPPGPRQRVYLAVWQRLQARSPEEQQHGMAAMSIWASVPRRMRSTRRTLTADELSGLAGEPGIEIGAHTVTHPRLPSLDRAAQAWELARSKAALEAAIGRPVSALAYPHGERSETTIALAREAGYQLACTTDPACVTPATLPFEVPRVQVEDWNGIEFKVRLRAWLAGSAGAAI